MLDGKGPTSSETFCGFSSVETVRDKLAEFEPGLRKDINIAYSNEYVDSAAALNHFEPAEFVRLGNRLKGQGIGLSRWEFAVKERARQERTRLREAADVARSSQRPGPGQAIAIPAIDPYPSPVKASDVFNSVRNFLQRFLIVTAEQMVAIVLWIAFTHAFEIADISPRLAIVSPRPRCGKSTLLRLLATLCAGPLRASNISAAAIFRTIDAAHPTLLIDEADTLVPKSASQQSERSEEIRGILNSGHEREGAWVIRVEKQADGLVPQRFSTWAPIAYAAILQLPDTWRDRSVELHIKRKLPSQPIEKLTRRTLPGAKATALELAQKLSRLAQDNLQALATAKPVLPAGLDDRAEDNWDILVAIAELAGGPESEWARAARKAALVLSAARDTDPGDDLCLKLLVDIRRIVGDPPYQKDAEIGSTELCDKLLNLELSPWATVTKGKALTPHKLARMLKDFEVYPKHCDHGNVYILSQLEDVFSRYLSKSASQSVRASETQRPVRENGDFKPSAHEGSKSAVSPTESETTEALKVQNGTGTHDAEKRPVAHPESQADAEIDRLALGDGWEPSEAEDLEEDEPT